MSDFAEKLASALGIPQPKTIYLTQTLYNVCKKLLFGREITSPLPERIHLLSENFLYWIKLENPNPSEPTVWIPAKAKIVIPQLEAGIFDESKFRRDEARAKAILHVPDLLGNPNCIHTNLRHRGDRGQGGIKGHYMYVTYYRKKTRKVAFTKFDPRLGFVVLTTSFWTHQKWVAGCAIMPPVYVRPGGKCICK